MLEARQPQDATFVDTCQVPVEAGDQLPLDAPESGDLGVPHEPVGVQRLPGPDDDGRLQREIPDLLPLLVQGQIVALHKLGVDPGDLLICVPAGVDHEEDAAIPDVVCLQLEQQAVEQLQVGRQLHAGEGLILLFCEDTQVDRVPGIEERTEELLRGYHCFVHKHSFRWYQKARPVWSCPVE